MQERDYTVMGRRIRLRRNELGYTQGHLAEILEVTPDFLLLGTMHAKDINRKIIDNLCLCTPEDRDLIRETTEYMIQRNQNRKQ